jgi:osmotically-inducible protein OsmY
MNASYSQPARYVTTMSFTYARTTPSRLRVDLQDVLQRSVLSTSRGIQVAMDGPVVVLQGKADNEHDRELAEALIRLRPGVYDVRNEIQVLGGPPAPSQ